MASSPLQRLLLSFDALGTLFRTRVPVGTTYRAVLVRAGRLPPAIADATVEAAFRDSLRVARLQWPNYGNPGSARAGIHDPSSAREAVAWTGERNWWAGVAAQTCARAEQMIATDTNTQIRKGPTDSDDKADSSLLPATPLPRTVTDELWQAYTGLNGYELYPDVRPFFAWLRELRKQPLPRRITVPVVSNSDTRVMAVLSSLGFHLGAAPRPPQLSSYALRPSGAEHPTDSIPDIDAVYSSYQIGLQKPDPRFFQLVAHQQAGNAAYGIGPFKVHIGDSFPKDCVAAIDSGFDSAVMLDRDNTEKSAQQVATTHGRVRRITSLTELAPLVEEFLGGI